MDQRIAIARQERITQIEKTRSELEDTLNRLQRDVITFQNVNEQVNSSQNNRISNLEELSQGKIPKDKIDVMAIVDNNLSYLEGKINKTQSDLQSKNAELESKIAVLEEKIITIEKENSSLKRESKVSIHNSNNMFVDRSLRKEEL